MVKKILDNSGIEGFIKTEELLKWQEKVSEVHVKIHEKTGEGNEFLGWLDLPVDYDKEELKKIKETAEKIRKESEVLVVIGIGGPYLASKPVVEALGGDGKVEICYSGNNLSSIELNKLLKKIEKKEVSLNVISKSGTTLETSLAFKLLREWIEKKYWNNPTGRIYATTDKEKGVLKKLADEKGYETFVVPDDVGGRFSFLTAVGLLPMAVSGINIDELIRGAAEARQDFLNEDILENEAYKLAVYRNILYERGKLVEILTCWEPSLAYVAEWWKQLFGESEGKDGKGIFPSSVIFSTDLHSMGQYIQDGNRILFETVLTVNEEKERIMITKDVGDVDGLNYLAGKTLDEVSKKAMEAAVMAHMDGGVPNIILRLPKLDAYNLGYLLYFFEKTCAMSAYLLGVNPFNQPGVEEYKKNMFKLLGKPGY
jgi:glucose-6-phosphate isomerase